MKKHPLLPPGILRLDFSVIDGKTGKVKERVKSTIPFGMPGVKASSTSSLDKPKPKEK